MTAPSECTSPDCTRPVTPGSAWCTGHRGRLYRTGDTALGVPFEHWARQPASATRCVAAGCADQALGGSLLCAPHGGSMVDSGACQVSDCDREPYTIGICSKDYKRWLGGHNRSRYRTRDGRCGGRCGVCRWDHAREAREDRLAALEQGPLSEQVRREIVARVWDGASLEEVAAAAGVSVKQVWSTGAAWPEFIYAIDAGLMATRDPDIPHGVVYSYRVRGCRCPPCRGAKARQR